uniref:Phosphodiesterase n=1 Tax=Glossina brevipalpis TaxID=37001 RepID=A0A1A9W0L3_9MUSC
MKKKFVFSGLHLRSIEEPITQLYGTQHTQQHHHIGNSCFSVGSNRMPTKLGGTGYGSEHSSHAGVPLTTYQQQQLQQHQQQILHPLTPQKVYDAEYARMEAWMDENQEFVQDYFIRKATRQVVDAWLVSHATTAGNDASCCNSSPTHTHPNGQNCSSRGGSGATTPVRKISAHEFERGGLLKPIVNTIDGTPTFLSIGTQNDCSASSVNMVGSSGATNNMSGVGSSNQSNMSSHHYYNNCYTHHHNHPMGSSITHCRPQRLSRNELKQLDEKELIFELVKDICNELEVRTLCHKILQNVSILLNADRGSLFLVQGRCSGNGNPKKCLVSKLFDVCPRSTVEEMEQQNEVQIAWGTGIAGHVAESGEPINIPDAYQDERFNCEIDTLTGYRTKALLCMPIKDSSGDVIGVAQVINKLNGERFTETDEKVFASYLQFCGIGLRNAQLYEKSQLEIKRNQVLLDLARMIFEEQSTIEHMVFRILTHMQSLIQCQRVQILLVHEASKGSFSRVFDFEANDLSEEASTNRTSPFESRFPINVGITGYVATTGETVSIANAYEDDRFDASVDENTNFKHKTILCMAIKNSLGQIIGVIQLINKFDDLDFTKNDENFVEAFAIFCGMGIHNTHMYEKAIAAIAKQSVTLEVLSYHASSTIDEAHRLRRLRVPSAAHFRLHDFRFDDIHFEDDDTLKACLRMFLDLDFVERFHIDYEVLCRWLLSVKKNYRNVTYHNWRHAFNVAQMMFAILTATQWWKIFGEVECLALIIACLCHDLDHRGTNNSFQIKASSPLAQLYSTSTMEHHHFDQCLMILNSPGNQILANLSSEDYCRVVRVLEDAILSTDLAVYLRKRGTFLQCVQEQSLNYWLDEEPRALLRAMSMTVCDLSAITKPWEIEKRVADLVSSEFFEQGDMEKQELNITPIAFAQLSDKLEPLVEGVRDNREHWIDLADQVQTKAKSNGLLKPNKENNGRSNDVSSFETTNSYQNTEVLDGGDSIDIKEIVNEECEETSYDHQSDGFYSSASSRLSTPPPTGEDDDSSPSSPAKRASTETQAKLIAANLQSLNQKPPKLRSCCKNCECMRIRKTSSLNGANELTIMPGGSKNHSKSTPSMSNCGVVGVGHQPSIMQYYHYNHHHHHHHHNHQHRRQQSSCLCSPHHFCCHHPCNSHQNHAQHCSSSGGAFAAGNGGAGSSTVCGGPSTTSSLSESDKIPKIVGKLGNLDTLHNHHVTINGTNAFAVTNGHFNYLPANLLSRRHSATNGSSSSIILSNNQAVPSTTRTMVTVPKTAAVCDK